MSEKEARIQALKYLFVVHELLHDVYISNNKNVLTNDHNAFNESIKSLTNQIKTNLVEIGLVDGHKWQNWDQFGDIWGNIWDS